MILDYQEAVAWISYATKINGAGVIALQLTDGQTLAVGYALKENKLLNPPRARKSKRYAFICACPCRKSHVTTYKTKKPKYISPAHKAAAFRKKRDLVHDLSGRPIICTTCMVRPVINPVSPIVEEKHTCGRCMDGLLLGATPID